MSIPIQLLTMDKDLNLVVYNKMEACVADFHLVRCVFGLTFFSISSNAFSLDLRCGLAIDRVLSAQIDVVVV